MSHAAPRKLQKVITKPYTSKYFLCPFIKVSYGSVNEAEVRIIEKIYIRNAHREEK